jgi:hypothetical protein
MRRAVYWLHDPLLAPRPLGAAWRVGLVGFPGALTAVDMEGWGPESMRLRGFLGNATCPRLKKYVNGLWGCPNRDVDPLQRQDYNRPPPLEMTFFLFAGNACEREK